MLGPAEIRELLERHGLDARKSLGQNFVADPSTVLRIARWAHVGPGDHVVEIGPGLGSLTLALVDTGASVLAVEKDRTLVPLLGAVLDERGAASVEVLEADAMTLDWQAELAGRAERWTLAANLPYNVAVPLIMAVLADAPIVDHLVVMVQKEVADRMKAGPTTPADYGPLTVTIQSLAEVKGLRTIPPTAFWPRPTIDSALVTLRRAPKVEDGRAFSRFVTAAFGQRRKALRNPLSKVVPPDRLAAVLAAAGLTGDERAEQVSVEQFRAMFAAME